MADVFVSYVEEDSEVAQALSEGLEAKGYSTWCYERHSVPGPSYLAQTRAAIGESRVFMIVLSRAALASVQIEKEVVRAHETGKRFVPVLRGITHAEFLTRQPEWAQAAGGATGIQLRDGAGVDDILPRIVRGLQMMHIEPGEAASPFVDTSSRVPPPVDPFAEHRGGALRRLWRLGRRRWRAAVLVCAGLAVVAALIANSGTTDAPRPAKEPFGVKHEATRGRVLFEQDLRAAPVWRVGRTGECDVRYTNGGHVVKGLGDQNTMCLWSVGFTAPSNVRIETAVRVLSGNLGQGVGLYFGSKPDGSGYYTAWISANDAPAVRFAYWTAKSWTMLHPDGSNWFKFNGINSGYGALNTLVVEVTPTSLRYLVNGQVALTAAPPFPDAGEVGVEVAPGLEGSFAYVRVTELAH